jgi:hypothetical protein
MPQPKRRLDHYGQVIPPLRDVREEALATRPTNLERRQLAVVLLNELLQEALRHGWYGTVELQISIEDGIIQQQVTSRMVRTHHS